MLYANYTSKLKKDTNPFCKLPSNFVMFAWVEFLLYDNINYITLHIFTIVTLIIDIFLKDHI